MNKIVSFGGGINSTAVLCGLLEHGERPDFILFADTGGEKPETYRHIEQMREWCGKVSFPTITVVKELLTLEQDCLDRETLPGKAFGFGSCSEHFKIRPQQRWVKASGLTDVKWLVGFHAGETSRRWPGSKEGQTIRHPLIEWNWGQAECVAAIQRAGLSVPVKSACFFCPSMRKSEILRLAEEHPDLLQRAVEMEQIAAPNMTVVKGLGRQWSWSKLVAADKQQQKLFGDEQSPICSACFDGGR